MKLIRSSSPEMARSITSAGAWASRNCHSLGFACAANVLAFLITLIVSLSVSVRAAALLSLPVFLSLNGYVLWRAKASRRRWLIVGCADRLYVRLFAWRSGDHDDIPDPDVLVLEASEVASMSIRTLEVLLDGPKPKIVDWLVIELSNAIEGDVSNHIGPSLTPLDPDKAVFVANEEERLTIVWKGWRPAPRVFLQRVGRESSSIVIGHEERSELDLNGIWRGISRNLRRNLDAQERQKLVQARRLGFGCDCVGLLSRYKHISFAKATAFLAEIERDEAGTGNAP